jgi:integrase/recombinase XerD
MLRVYRRHVKSCRFWTGKSTNGNRRDHNCRCPVWVDGYLAGKRVNRSLKLRDWTRANQIVRDWEIAGTIEPAQKDDRAGMPIADACDAFMADAEAQRLSEASLKKYRVLLINRHKPEDRKKYSPSLAGFCAETAIQFTNQITLVDLTRFRAQWKDGPISGGKKLERLRAVGRFFAERGWWIENLTLKLKRPTVKFAPTMPYTREEMAAMLAACEQYIDWRGHAGQENARRLRAFLLLARYSALRIGDAASCAVDRLSGNRLFLYMQKTGVPVYVPLPPFVVSALEACPRISERYWFWTGIGSKETLAGNWRRTFRRLCQIAGVQGGHPHRFRDTLAVELLLEGVPMERVSVLLGHSSVKITERHYAPWVQARQAQLESDLARAWRNDPIAQMEMLRSDTSLQDGASQRMAATYLRHENGEAPN